MVLVEKGELDGAEQLLRESLAKDSGGVNAGRARSLLAEVKSKKRTRAQNSSQSEDKTNPEDGGQVAANGGASDASLDSENPSSRRALMFAGGALGFTTGLALAGPEDEFGRVRPLAVGLAVLGAASFAAGGYLLDKKLELSGSESRLVLSASLWGGFTFGLMGDVVTGTDDTTANAIFISSAIGQIAGGVGGYFYASHFHPSLYDVSLINSGGLYGSMFGLLLATGIGPPEGEAYTLQTALGSFAGLAIGAFASQHLTIPRKRMRWVDAGVLVGAALPWALIYPVLSDRSKNSDERILGGISLISMVGGGAAMIYLTREGGLLEGLGSPSAAVSKWIPVPRTTRLGDGFALDWSGRF